MKIAFDLHKYAPELSKVLVKGPRCEHWVVLKASTGPANGWNTGTLNYDKNVRDFRALNTQRARAGRYVSIAVQYCTEAGKVIHQKPYSGYVPSYQALKDFVEALKVRHNLPHTVIKVVSIKYICG